MSVVISTHDCFHFEAKQISFLLIPVVSGSFAFEAFESQISREIVQTRPKYASFTLHVK